jgi:hypothetical protein
MGSDGSDKNPDFGSVFFILLFLVFALIYSGRSEKQILQSFRYSPDSELTIGNSSIHLDADIFSISRLPDLYRLGINALHEISFNQFSLRSVLSGYNQSLTQNLIKTHSTTLELKPLLLRRLFYHHSSGDKEDLPFLS